MKILIQNGILIDPYNNLEKKQDLLVEDGKIIKIDDTISDSNARIIDASHLWVVPGLIDMHVHLREPGQTHKEDIYTGSKSAVRGGFTTICCMPNTNPIIDSVETVTFIKDKSKNAFCHVLPIGTVTVNQEGKELAPFKDMKKAGICALSEDGKTVANAHLFKESLLEAKKENLLMLSHCEEPTMTGGLIHESTQSKNWKYKGVPRAAEDLITARDIYLSIDTGCPLHLCHVSTKDSIFMLKLAKEHKYPISGEVTPHHFTLTVDDIKKDDTNYKMSPPLREEEDVLAIIEALKDNTIEVIATDHAPHSEEEKALDFSNAPNGIIGLETAIPLSLTELYHKNHLTPLELIAKFTNQPAKLLGIDKGTLGIGKDADITIIDPDIEYQIDKNKMHSKSKNTPFHNRKVKGRTMVTIVDGKVVYDGRDE